MSAEFIQGALLALPPASETGCPRCGQQETCVAWHEGRGARYLKLMCVRCGAHVKSLPRTPENVALAGEGGSS